MNNAFEAIREFAENAGKDYGMKVTWLGEVHAKPESNIYDELMAIQNHRWDSLRKSQAHIVGQRCSAHGLLILDSDMRCQACVDNEAYTEFMDDVDL